MLPDFSQLLRLSTLTLLSSLAGLLPAIAAPDSAPLTVGQAASQLVSQTGVVSQTAQPMQQGNQVVLNGRTLTAAWAQWQRSNAVRLGISDLGLTQIAGVELLDTLNHTQQPLQWFNFSAANPLPTRLTPTLRLLDITEFAQQAGWQMQVSGSTLKITTPAAKVLAVRVGKQPWGDRIVLELDRPAPWQVDQQSQELRLTLQAQTVPTLTQLPKLSNSAQSLKLETTSAQTLLRIGIPQSLRPKIWSLANPPRLVIDLRPDGWSDRTIQWAPGLRWHRQTFSIGSARFPVMWFAIDPRLASLSLKPILPNPTTLQGTAPLLQTAQQAGVAAAINGGFFNRNNQLPLGAVRLDGRWLSGPILNRGAIAWDATGNFKIGRLTLQETIVTSTGQRLPLAYLNSAYPGIGIIHYTANWGASYTPLTNNEIVISVIADRVVDQQTALTAEGTPIPIPANGYLLVVRSNAAVANVLKVGTALRLESSTLPTDFDRYPQVVAAGPLLLQNRQILLDPIAEQFSKAFANEYASRSAIGQTADGTVLIVAVHNRINGVGASLTEMTQIMQQIGSVNALNLDGGSSTTLYLGGQVVDRLPRTAARVHNGIGIYLQPDP